MGRRRVAGSIGTCPAGRGVLVGADPLGVLFDGSYTPDGKGGFAGKVIVKAPPNGELVQGVTTAPDGLTYEVGIEIPADFETRPFLTLSTPLAPINFLLKRIRSVGCFHIFWIIQR